MRSPYIRESSEFFEGSEPTQREEPEFFHIPKLSLYWRERQEMAAHTSLCLQSVFEGGREFIIFLNSRENSEFSEVLEPI